MVISSLHRKPLYRKLTAVVICAALVAGAAVATGVLAYGQHKHSHELRAIALVELYGTSAKTAKPTGGRLLPIAILVGDKWYDAATYTATPRPLALDEGTVYEALDNGDAAGFFTVAAARQDHEKGEWFGVGQWKSRAEAERAEKAAAAARHERERTLTDEGPPKLRKPKPGETGPAPRKQEDHPLVVPQTAQPERPAPASPGTTSTADPDRPTLRHGGGGEQVSATLEPPPPAPAGKSADNRPALATRNGTSKPGGPSQVYIAVSDPDGTGVTRNFGFPWKPEEERALKAKAVALAEAEVAKYRATRAGAGATTSANRLPPKSGSKGSAKKRPAPVVHLENVQVAGYDLALDNNLDLVVTATSGDAFVTLVARTDLQFEPRKIFAVVTDKDHLDAIPRMELVGAIDADGKGKGELLFRVIGEGSYRYALYRVMRESMPELWQSGRYEQ